MDRGFYVLSGLVLFIIKWNIDRLLGAYFFDAKWMPYEYLFPGTEFAGMVLELKREAFLLLLLGTALPFIYVGVTLTVKAASFHWYPHIPRGLVLCAVYQSALLCAVIMPARQGGGDPS